MRSEYFNLTDYGRVLARMTPENALAVRVSLETGLRIGDVLKIKVNDIHKRTLYYVAEKTGKAGKKVLSPELVKALRREGGSGGYVFKSPVNPLKHRTRQAVWQNLKRAAAECGITSNLTPHSARKTYAVEEYHEHGINAAAAELQHSNIQTTLLYALSDTAYAPDAVDTAFGLSAAQLAKVVYSACMRALEDYHANR